MSKIGKLVTSLIATQIIYGGYYLFSFKQIILPLPLNELILCFVIFTALIIEKKELSKFQFILITLLGLVELLKSQFLLRICFSVPFVEKINQSFYFDILFLLKGCLIGIIYFQWIKNLTIHKIIKFVFPALLSLIIIIPNINIILTNVIIYISIILLFKQFQKISITNMWLIIVFEFLSTYWMTGTFSN